MRGRRYVTLNEASAMLDGLLSPGMLRNLVRAGQVPGAVRAGRRYFVPRATVSELVTDMGAVVVEEAPPRVPRPQRNTFDARAG